jgi:AcrR family transcriptional regulator
MPPPPSRAPARLPSVANSPKPRRPPARSTYRHGDLQRALLEAGVQLARAGGPDAVVLREATRRVGVAPNAAYRHFASREDLLEAVRAAALAALAVAMEQELAGLQSGDPGEPQRKLQKGPQKDPKKDPQKDPQRGVQSGAQKGVQSGAKPAEVARANLRAVGAGYLRFALTETGLFRTAFSVPAQVEGDRDPAKTGGSGLNPFQLLGAALDLLVQSGALPEERRPGAEYLAWSAVHGLALLLIDGPLKRITPKEASTLGQRLLDMVEKGL